MTDWATISSLATAGATLLLAVGTFASVRSANRAARTAERMLLAGLRPVLVPSGLEDPTNTIRWVDDHWATLSGGRASIELVDRNVYLAISLRNVGAGIAYLQGWHPPAYRPGQPHTDVDQFRRQGRDLYIPAGGIGFWQGAVRDGDDDAFREGLVAAITERRGFAIELLYSDHEGGQRTISLFWVTPPSSHRDADRNQWMCSVLRHWNLDRPNPR